MAEYEAARRSGTGRGYRTRNSNGERGFPTAPGRVTRLHRRSLDNSASTMWRRDLDGGERKQASKVEAKLSEDVDNFL